MDPSRLGMLRKIGSGGCFEPCRDTNVYRYLSALLYFPNSLHRQHLDSLPFV